MALKRFSKTDMYWKNYVLELWTKNFLTKQNTEFVKLQFLRNEQKFEVEVSYVTRYR